MHGFLIAIHILVCFIMIAVILLQSGKGAEMGAAFGGSSQTLFGSRGPGTFLSKMTIGAAVVFMLTSLSLAILSKHQKEKSIMEDMPAAPSAGAAVPGAPGQVPAAPGQQQPAAGQVPASSGQGSAQAPAAPPAGNPAKPQAGGK